MNLADYIRDIPDFPKPGIVFKDLMPLVADPVYFRETIDRLAALARPKRPDVILGAEARGFIFGGALAPIIATALYARFGTSTAIAVYMAIVCAITLLSVFLLSETYQTDMDEEAEGARDASERAGRARGPATS